MLFRLILLIALFSINPVHALELNAGHTELTPTTAVEYLEDKTGQLTLADIITADHAQQFKPVNPQNKVIIFGQSNSTFWLKLALNRTEKAESEWVLDIQNNHLDEITFYGFNTLPIKTGDLLPFATRPYAYRYFVFPVSIETQSHDYYLKVKSNYTISFPLVLSTVKNFYINNQKATLIQAIYFGATTVISLFSFFVFLSIKDKRFLYYSLFVSFFSLAMFAKQGFGRTYFWQDFIFFDSISQSFFSALSGVFSILFTREFINAKQLSLKIDTALKVPGYFFLVIAIFLLASDYFAIPSKSIFTLLFINSQFATFIIIFAVWQTYRTAMKSTKLFFIAWVIFFVGLSISNLRTFGLISANNFTINSIQIFSAIEILLWSIAFINTFFEERKLIEDAQTQARTALKLLIETQMNHHDDLELKITERTHELEVSIEAEKTMRAKQLRFNAIISHELRNPLAIIDTHASLILREQSPPIDSLTSRINIIKLANRRILALFDKWLDNDRMSVMENRLVLSDVNIYALMDSIFTESKQLYPEHHFVLLTDNAQQQIIAAHHDWLEIVLKNLIDNACKYSEPQTKITLQCYQDKGHTCITVVDQGIGIAPEFHEQIYDEYYRVTESKKLYGLGLGLSLVKKVVDLHHARIELISALQQGTTFRIIFNNNQSN